MSPLKRHDGQALWYFLGGLAAGAAGAVLAEALSARRLDPRLLGPTRHATPSPPVVIVPGILGSELLGPDGTHRWLNIRNAFGHHDLTLPFAVPFTESRDRLVPGGLIGADAVLPRVFGFTEYADLLELLASAGYVRAESAQSSPRTCHVFTYDWRRDLVESARALGGWLDARAEAAGTPDLRFDVVGHSMGGLVSRYYLRYGGAEPGPDQPVTWAGARRIRSLTLVAPPNGGSIGALDAVLNGSRVGLSYTTLAASVVAPMPSIYELLPPRETRPLLDETGRELEADLHDVSTWERLGWGPFRPFPPRRRSDEAEPARERQAHVTFLEAALRRARAFHEALATRPESPCPVRVILLGGDCLPTPARVIVQGPRGTPPRFEPWTRAESEVLLEAGDGRVTRASASGSHLSGAEDSPSCTGYPEIAQAVFGDAEHHGIYAEPTFQSLLLRQILRPAPPRLAGRSAPVRAEPTNDSLAEPRGLE